MPATLLLLALGGEAYAELRPPDYRDALLARAEAEADALLAAGQREEALRRVRAFRREVADDARLTYEEGLVLQLLGRPEDAERLHREALAQDPALAAAWYDLAGLLLVRGREEEAERAYEEAAALTQDHPQGWAAPIQLALLAARRQDAAGLERWLRVAVERGLRFAELSQNAEWTAILHDPTLGPVLQRLIVVYGEERLLELWGP